MIRGDEIVSMLEQWAPLDLQEAWDRSGWQINFHQDQVTGIYLAMDITPRVIKETIESGSNFILTHHPFLFQAINQIDGKSIRGKMLVDIISNKISIYSAHTNLDKAPQGVNDQWADMLGLQEIEILDEQEGIGVVGSKPTSLSNLVSELKQLGVASFKGYGKRKEEIKKLAVLGGSGSDYTQQAKNKGADILITGDMSHHKGQEAYESDLMVLDIGHFESEKFILERMKERLEQNFPEIPVYLSRGCDFVFDL